VGLGVAAGAQPLIGPFAAAYVLLLAVAGSVLMRFADRIPSPLRRSSARARPG